MFGFALLAAATLLHLYVFGRAASVPAVTRRVPRWTLFGAGAAVWAAFVAARFLAHGGTGPAAVALDLFGMTWLGVLFLVSMCLLAADILTVFGILLPRVAPALRGVALLAGALLSAIALVQGSRPPVVESLEVSVPGMPGAADGTTLVAMSDLHLGATLGERWMRSLAAQVRAASPDFIVLLGDIVEGHGPPRPEIVSALATLSAPLGVFAVPGNHESHGGEGNGGLPFEVAGIRLLRNRWVEVRPGVVLAGIDDLTADGRARAGGGAAATRPPDDAPARALSGRPPGAAILLSHTPWQAGNAARAGAGLMLSGHTHGGGQIWPLGYLVRRVYPLVDGIYDVNRMTVIVSRGAGTWGPRMRLWRPAQILRITLRAPGVTTRGVPPSHGGTQRET